MIDLLVIDDKHLKAIASDPRAVAALPCLAVGAITTSGKKGCRTCRGKKQNATDNVLNQVRRCLASARGASLAQVKTVLGAKKLRIISRNSRGQSVRWTL